MNESIFRKKSLDKVKSPENLDDYIRVTNPGVWLILISVIILLIGACVWGVFGRVDSTVDTVVLVENAEAVCTVAETDVTAVKEGMEVTFGDYSGEITAIAPGEDQGYVGVLQTGNTPADGSYQGKIVVNSVKPLSFIIN